MHEKVEIYIIKAIMHGPVLLVTLIVYSINAYGGSDSLRSPRPTDIGFESFHLTRFKPHVILIGTFQEVGHYERCLLPLRTSGFHAGLSACQLLPN